MRFPLKNEKGQDQTITFPPIADQKAGAATSLKLSRDEQCERTVLLHARRPR